MRSVLTISLPEDKKKLIQIRALKMGKSLSAYILHAVDTESLLINEDQVVKIGKKAKKDYQEKKTKVLKSFSELM